MIACRRLAPALRARLPAAAAPVFGGCAPQLLAGHRFAASFAAKIGEAAKVVTTISAADAKAYIAKENPIIIDVRDGSDTANGITGAVNISLAELPFKADESFSLPEDVTVKGEVAIPKGTSFVHEKLKGAKSKPILVSCGLGGQALLGAQILVEYGFTNVKAVDGGNIAWMNTGGEVCECMK
mmetsp:Transcript_123584/g.344089  ORF Transcript_123584/g.344089 Transcript_123584/m.344089 type:complete len:183 (+) Transcript_123584:68-616(+)